jgi:hypothetical protein
MMSTPNPNPISLSDDELSFIMRVTEPLNPHDRSAYLHALAELLRQEPVIGPGVLYRLAKKLLPEFWRPPTISTPQAPRLSSKAHAEPAIWASARRS